MIICSAKIIISTRECDSLKEKRAIIKSIKEKAQNRFNITIAEVDYSNDKKRSLIGIACISNDDGIANSIIDKTIDFIENSYPGRIADVSIEIDIK